MSATQIPASGRAARDGPLDRLAADRGPASAVTAAAHRGEPWAEAMLDRVLAPLALALRRAEPGADAGLIGIADLATNSG